MSLRVDASLLILILSRRFEVQNFLCPSVPPSLPPFLPPSLTHSLPSSLPYSLSSSLPPSLPPSLHYPIPVTCNSLPPPSNSDLHQLSQAVRGTAKRRRAAAAAAASLSVLPAASVAVSAPLVAVCAVRSTALLCSAAVRHSRVLLFCTALQLFITRSDSHQ